MRGLTNLGGGGGLTAEEHGWLESLANFQPNMYDINPEKQTGTWIYGLWCGGGSGMTKGFTSLPVSGYAKFAIYNNSGNRSFKISYYDTHGQKVTEDSTISPAANTWCDYQDIPSGTAFLYITSVWQSTDTVLGAYSLLTADSPYNPDNQ